MPLARVSVFMNVFDCHVNRAPAAGRIARIAYRPGKFVNADLDKASEDNERNGLVIETADGPRSASCRSPAWWRGASSAGRGGRPGGQGERFGMIRFGSRLDVYLPDGRPSPSARGQRADRRRDGARHLPGATRRRPSRAAPTEVARLFPPVDPEPSGAGRPPRAGAVHARCCPTS